MEGNGKKVMIFGGTGLLGYYAGLEFLKRGYRVSALYFLHHAQPDTPLERSLL